MRNLYDTWKKTGKLRPILDEGEFELLEKHFSHVDEISPVRNAAGKPSNIKKGVVDGVRFDSKWEAIVYLYYSRVECIPIERNLSEYLTYVDEKGKTRKFYPDFKTDHYIEVKGQYRDSDIQKLAQHPEVEFIDSSQIYDLRKKVEEKIPNWEDLYLNIT